MAWKTRKPSWVLATEMEKNRGQSEFWYIFMGLGIFLLSLAAYVRLS